MKIATAEAVMPDRFGPGFLSAYRSSVYRYCLVSFFVILSDSEGSVNEFACRLHGGEQMLQTFSMTRENVKLIKKSDKRNDNIHCRFIKQTQP